MEATKHQKTAIRKNCGYDVNTKEEFVQWATGDTSKTSLNDLSYEQATKIIEQQTGKPYKGENFTEFDKNNQRHKFLLSLCIQYGWRKSSQQYGAIANLDKLNDWMHTPVCPVNKPLKEMTNDELTKVIGALEQMTKKKYK